MPPAAAAPLQLPSAPPFSARLPGPGWQSWRPRVPLSALCRASAAGALLVVFNATFHFIFTRVRGETFSREWRGAVVLLAPMWSKNIIGRSLCGAVLVTLRAGEAMTTNCPPPPSQGQGWWVCQGPCSLDLLSSRLSFVRKDPVPPNAYGHFDQERWGRIQPAFLFYPFPGCDHTQIPLSLWFSPLNKCEPAFYHSLYTLSIKAWQQTQ